MKAEHTQGPWFMKPADDWRDSEGRWLQYGSYLISAGSDKQRDERYYRIAQVSNVNDSPQNEANARLIAAAPALLKACQQAIYALKGREHDGFLRAAIAAATGESHE